MHFKRCEIRQALELPVQFRPIGADDSEMVFALTSNISLAGLFMSTNVLLNIGTQLSLSIQIPASISGSYRAYFHCTGAVVHKRQLSELHHGYGVKFANALSMRQSTSTSAANPSTSSHPSNVLAGKC